MQSHSNPLDTPFKPEVIRKLKAVCDKTIVSLRNRLLLQLGYESMRRRSEICAFRFDDVKHYLTENSPYSYIDQKQISLVRVS